MILYLDTNIVIYFFELHPVWSPLAKKRVAMAEIAGNRFQISDLVRMECLILPIRLGLPVVEAQYHAFFARPDVQVVPITAAVCDRAARIRAFHNLKAMDALQLAAAVEHGANTFLTADARLGSFPDITVEILR